MNKIIKNFIKKYKIKEMRIQDARSNEEKDNDICQEDDDLLQYNDNSPMFPFVFLVVH